MTSEQQEAYTDLGTIQERATFLLNIGVTAKINIVNLTPCYQASVGEMVLPVTAETEQEAIKNGEKWLEEKKADA